MRSTPDQDELLRLRLIEAVEKFAGESADKFGRMVGYTNGGYIRECINKIKPVRETLIDRVHGTEGMAGWFAAHLSPITASDLGDPEEKALLSIFLALPQGSAARREILGYARGVAAASGANTERRALPKSPMALALSGRKNLPRPDPKADEQHAERPRVRVKRSATGQKPPQ